MLRGRSSSASSREYVASQSLDTPYMELGHPLPASLHRMHGSAADMHALTEAHAIRRAAKSLSRW